jgi:hypothetical protein
MSDLNPDVPDKPIEVSTSPAGTQAATGSRDFLLLVAALPALVAVLGTHNVKDIVDWFAGEQGLAFLGLVIAIGTPLWRQWLARRKHANELKMAKSADDSVATVVTK